MDLAEVYQVLNNYQGSKKLLERILKGKERENKNKNEGDKGYINIMKDIDMLSKAYIGVNNLLKSEDYSKKYLSIVG